MNPPKFARTLLAAAATLLFANPTYAAAPRQAPHRDAQHDFDFHFGTWLTHIRALGARGQWTHMTGTVTDLPVWHGRANLEKIEAAGPGGHFQGVTLFLYNPKTDQWSQRYASSTNGIFDPAYYVPFFRRSAAPKKMRSRREIRRNKSGREAKGLTRQDENQR